MWSATWPKEVQDLARSYCNVQPVHIQIGNPGVTANIRITQIIDVVEEYDKYNRYVLYLILKFLRFKDFLKNIPSDPKILVFCETKRGVDDLAKQMRYDGWHGVRGIHGDKT